MVERRGSGGGIDYVGLVGGSGGIEASGASVSTSMIARMRGYVRRI